MLLLRVAKGGLTLLQFVLNLAKEIFAKLLMRTARLCVNSGVGVLILGLGHPLIVAMRTFAALKPLHLPASTLNPNKKLVVNDELNQIAFLSTTFCK
jgi:hypothetical protein